MSEKIAGCLIGAAYGDALGAPTENRTREQIFEKWGYVDRLHDAPSDVYARGNKAGQITDDFSMGYVTIQQILRSENHVNQKVAEGALIEWSKNERFFDQFVGPTSRKFINRLKGIETEGGGFEPVNDNMKASNGGAMKIGPVACFGKGDMEKTLEIAKVIRLGFLLQNAFHKDDTCVSLEKQFKMMDVILYLYKTSRKLVAMGMPMSVLKAEGIFEKVIAIKYDVPNDNLQLLDLYKLDIDDFYNRVIEKNA